MPTGSQSQPRDHQQQQEENARFFSPGRSERTEANRRALPAVWGGAASHDKPVHLAASMPSSVDNLERQLRDTKLDATAPSFMSTSAASRYTHATNVDQVPAPQVTYTPALYADYSIHAAVPA
ncbi:hypothetical protein Tdes44962_MAKER07877 [Teratosphaeria destructans]|uniref:Uncharacterized protein n=1 Tax=Teratosphaeria destructans TaxID=418781 RepID=A0A9W7W5F2_9PEZI|nr:hypothetical protein Tdes44962_MAKER07877 [Teratosphaeria destructans]